MTTNKSTTETIIHGINILSLNHDYRKSQDFYKDNTSEVTVTSKTLPHINNDWLDDIDNSSDNYKHHSIIQSYLEPACPSSNHSSTTIPVVTTRSKYSAIKSRMKRVFRISKVDKQQILMQSSLPVFSANERWTSPSIDSMCSSTTTAAATGSSRSSKTYNRNSCGLSTASFTKRSSRPVTENKVKSCLKTRVTSYAVPPRPTSVIDRKKRWSSMISPSKKRFSHMILKRKKSTELFTDETTITTRGIKFNKYVNVHETWSRVEYDRSSDPEAVCTRLTPNLAQLIKQELNHYKLHDMAVHDSSRINTHFFL
ncbi:hypothetical protein MFLAVUS_010047 [Mucor flavus]|uniref:Uncharacterized protein n=1 Tax=Mucor flavus TaxID=439312 RepID=A0ABP9ZBL6_9FUNG